MKIRILFFIMALVFSSFGQELQVGLYHSSKVYSITIEPNSGTYELYDDTTFIQTVKSGLKLEFKVANGRVILLQVAKNNRSAKSFALHQTQNSSSLTYRVNKKERKHAGGVVISASTSGLMIVNRVKMNDYLSGVIESEGGSGRHSEYYKVQAVMSRTYAVKNLNRHKSEGFQLCDGVHCQAYHHELKTSELIREAVNSTVGEVLVDSEDRLVTSYFSANCGGEICDASYVWNTSVDYVVPFIDTFCTKTWQANWTNKIEKYKWKEFLQSEYDVREDVFGDLIYNFEQNQRKAFFIHPSLGIPLRDLRSKFKLKSIFFSTQMEGDYVVISGRGFGHGVGLCQEGAMEMAKSNFDYKQIALFYFTGVRIMDYFKESYFKQEGEVEF